MKRSEKKGVLIGSILTLMGLVGLIYTVIVKNTIENTYLMYTSGAFYLSLGIGLIIYFIKLSKNKEKSDEQDNIYEDERLRRNKDRACAITFSIIIWASIVAEFMVTFFFTQYEELAANLQLFTILLSFLYLISYYFVSKEN